MNIKQLHNKIVKATFEQMSNITFWEDIIAECNKIRLNSTSIAEIGEAEQLFCQAEAVIRKLEGL